MLRSVYIHIPFCSNICSYCDFAKVLYNKKIIDKYLDCLEIEIKNNYKNEKIHTIYIGGGTPSSLSVDELKHLFNIIKIFNLNNSYEFTFECNIENIDREKLEFLYDNGVNRLSIGIQTFNKKYLKFLNRNHTKKEVFEKISLAKKIGFNNINIDLIYALKHQSLKELKEDIDMFLSLDINHISTYSLIIEPHTLLYINKEDNINEELDLEMYNLICETLKQNGFNHYEISNFAKDGYESKHNLTYWNNEQYYGFGLGASGYIKNIRYTNTRNLSKYLKCDLNRSIKKISFNEMVENEFILGFRKINGINIKKFRKKYKIDILKIDIIKYLLNSNDLVIINDNIMINKDKLYIENDILWRFLDVDYQNCKNK